MNSHFRCKTFSPYFEFSSIHNKSSLNTIFYILKARLSEFSKIDLNHIKHWNSKQKNIKLQISKIMSYFILKTSYSICYHCHNICYSRHHCINLIRVNRLILVLYQHYYLILSVRRSKRFYILFDKLYFCNF